MKPRRIAFWIAGSLIGALLLWFLVGIVLILDAGWPARSSRNVSTAMTPTLLPGETFSIALSSRDSLRDVAIVYRFPADTAKQFVHRVVGIPGDTLAMKRAHLSRNGAAIDEPYIAPRSSDQPDSHMDEFLWQVPYVVDSIDVKTYRPTRDNWGPLVVPEGQYFVLGDNRQQSLDSRYWGFVSKDHLVGRPRRVYFSRDPTTGKIRWSRLLQRIS